MSEAIPPVVCTLTTKQQACQTLEWADLAPLALTRSAIQNGITATYPLSMADQIEDLAQREISCCGSWLSIEHVRTADAFRLTITTTNPDGLSMIRSLSGLSG